MKHLASYLTTFLIISVIDILACSCPPVSLDIARNKEFNNSNVIVIAKVEKSYFVDSLGAQEFNITVIERFKGDFQENKNFKVLNSMYCIPAIDTGTFLLYLTKHNSNYWVNTCGLSRSIHTPENHNSFKTPPPPPPMEIFRIDDSDSNLIRYSLINDSLLEAYWDSLPDTSEQDKMTARKELEIEILMLREEFK